MSPSFRKKPIVIEAMQIPLKSKDEAYLRDMAKIAVWLGDSDKWVHTTDDGGIDIETLEGVMHGSPGDWIIRGIHNEYYPCKSDIFEKTYEKVND